MTLDHAVPGCQIGFQGWLVYLERRASQWRGGGGGEGKTTLVYVEKIDFQPQLAELGEI